MKLGKLIDLKKCNNIEETFKQLEGLGKVLGFSDLATCSSYSITNYVKILVFHFFGKLNRGHLKIVNVNY